MSNWIRLQDTDSSGAVSTSAEMGTDIEWTSLLYRALTRDKAGECGWTQQTPATHNPKGSPTATGDGATA